MQRRLLKELMMWKTHPLRTPLIVRGARQVGKSYLIAEFGKTFTNCVTINFDRDKKIKAVFQGSLDPKALISALSAYTEQKIIPGETLLFFDEAQECTEALQSLRYFKEELTALHVIAAGSLLDFALDQIGLPVGRVQFLFLHPLSFGEYLEAMGKTELNQYRNQKNIPSVLHEKLLEEMRHYAWLGGMPAVVNAWHEHHNSQFCQEIQDQMILTYRQDFEKYAKKHQIPLLNAIVDQAGIQLGQKFKYSRVDNSVRSYALKGALQLLNKAGILHVVNHTSAQGLPLAATASHEKFKIFYFDIGLLQRLQGLHLKEWLFEPLSVTYMGALAEQLVLQEYIANTSISTPPELFYWHREEKQSNAEVDFIFHAHHKIIPVEVKSGKRGRLRSMDLFLETHPHCTTGLIISENSPWQQDKLTGIPFYALESWLKDANQSESI